MHGDTTDVNNFYVYKFLHKLLSCHELPALSADVILYLCTTVQQYVGDSPEQLTTIVKILQLLTEAHETVVKVIKVKH